EPRAWAVAALHGAPAVIAAVLTAGAAHVAGPLLTAFRADTVALHVAAIRALKATAPAGPAHLLRVGEGMFRRIRAAEGERLLHAPHPPLGTVLEGGDDVSPATGTDAADAAAAGTGSLTGRGGEHARMPSLPGGVDAPQHPSSPGSTALAPPAAAD